MVHRARPMTPKVAEGTVVLTLVVVRACRYAAEEANPDISEYRDKVRQNFGLQVGRQAGGGGHAYRVVCRVLPGGGLGGASVSVSRLSISVGGGGCKL